MKIFRLFAVGAAALAVASSTAFAQGVDASRLGLARQNLVSANPIGLLFEWYNGEYEHAFNSTTSVAVAASSFGDFGGWDDARYSLVDVIGRYYPAGRALRGFSIGASAGLVNFDENIPSDCFECDDDSGTFATIGVRGDYVWILGRDQRFAVASGIGARRILGGGDLEGVPIIRLSIGYAW